MDDTSAALLLLVEALILKVIRKNLPPRDEMEALRLMVRRNDLPKNEIEALLVTMIRKKLLSRDEMIGAIEDAVQALLADGHGAQAEVLRQAQDHQRRLTAGPLQLSRRTLDRTKHSTRPIRRRRRRGESTRARRRWNVCFWH